MLLNCVVYIWSPSEEEEKDERMTPCCSNDGLY